MYEAAIHDELVRSLNRTMLNNYNIDMEKTKAIDHMQQNVSVFGDRAGSFLDVCRRGGGLVC